MAESRKLNVVDESGDVIGTETREDIHKQGLLHKEIHVLFYTPQGEIIFQHRSKDKDMYPDLLAAGVGGHVEIGSDYEDTALQEVQEETGLRLSIEDLAFIQMVRSNNADSATDGINNHLRAVYAHRFEGKIEDLRIEEGDAVGFESWPLEKVLNIGDEEKKRFIPQIIGKEYMEIYEKIAKMI